MCNVHIFRRMQSKLMCISLGTYFICWCNLNAASYRNRFYLFAGIVKKVFQVFIDLQWETPINT